MRLTGVYGRATFATQNIRATYPGRHMFRILAAAVNALTAWAIGIVVVAVVINVVTGRDQPDKQFIDNSMRLDRFAIPSDPSVPVAFCCGPGPTAISDSELGSNAGGEGVDRMHVLIIPASGCP